MTRLDVRTVVCALIVLAAVPLVALRPTSVPSVGPVINVNPVASDCYVGAGCLDPTFGTLGKVRLDVGGRQDPTGRYQTGLAIAAQPDGKMVVAGTSRFVGTDHAWIIARFESNGTLDSSFASGGIATIPNFTAGADIEQPYAVAVQSDGKIVVAGWAGYEPSGAFRSGVIRLTASGAPDSSFGTAGTAIVNFSGRVITAMKIQPDGKILLGTDNSGWPTGLVARLKTNGAIDTGFGANGFLYISFLKKEASSSIASLALQSNGKIIVGGFTYGGVQGQVDFALRRLTTSGSTDNSFGGGPSSGGTAVVDFLGYGDKVRSIAVAADDSIVAAGGASESLASGSNDMAFARFTANGALVTSFGNSGKVVLNMHGGNDLANDVVIQPNGTIVFTGYALTPDFPTAGYRSFIIVGRLQANGALDPTFGSGGVTETSISERDQSNALAIDLSGRITVTGYSIDPSSNPDGKATWALARYIQ